MSKWKRKTENDNYELSCDARCAQCGKDFFIPAASLWTWKTVKAGKTLYCCSYSCRQALRKTIEAEAEFAAEEWLRQQKQSRHEAYLRKKAAKEAKQDDNK